MNMIEAMVMTAVGLNGIIEALGYNWTAILIYTTILASFYAKAGLPYYIWKGN